MINGLAVLLMAVLLVCYLPFICGRAYADTEPEVTADSAVVMSISTGQVVYRKNSDRKLPIYGAERLVAAMTVIDNMSDKNREMKNNVEITSDEDALGDLFTAGQTVSVKNLLRAELIGGSQEAEMALAIYTSGSEGSFVDAMNNKVKDLGLANTVFTNATGTYDENQYTTAEDYAAIVRKAMSYDEISSICGRRGYKISLGGGGSVDVQNSQVLLDDASGASKNGFGIFAGIEGPQQTPENTCSYMAASVKNDMKMVTIVASDPEDKLSEDMVNLTKWGFRHVKKNLVIRKGHKAGSVMIRHGERTRVGAYAAVNGYAYIPKEGSRSLVKSKTVLKKHLKAPLKAGTKVGEYRIYVAGELTDTVDLVTKSGINTGWYPSYIYISNRAAEIAAGLLGLYILIRICTAIRNHRVRKRRKAEHQRKVRELARKRKAIEDDRKRRHWTYH